MSLKLTLAAALTLTAMALAPAGLRAQDTTAPAPAETPAETPAEAPLPAVPDMVLGQADAPVTVIEYASYTCSHCGHFHLDVFPKLKENYIDTGKVKLIYREVYFDKYGLWAALVARCGGEMRYFGINAMLLDDQKSWLEVGTDTGIADNLRKIGLKAGLTAEQIDQCMNDQAMVKAMIETYQKNATADKIEGTPSFVIDGQLYQNMGYEEFSKVLDEKLAK